MKKIMCLFIVVCVALCLVVITSYSIHYTKLYESFNVLGTLMSKVKLENGHWNPTRVGTLILNINSCRHCLICSNVILSCRINGAQYVSKLDQACAPAVSPCVVNVELTTCPRNERKCLAGLLSTLPGMPPKPCIKS